MSIQANPFSAIPLVKYFLELSVSELKAYGSVEIVLDMDDGTPLYIGDTFVGNCDKINSITAIAFIIDALRDVKYPVNSTVNKSRICKRYYLPDDSTVDMSLL